MKNFSSKNQVYKNKIRKQTLKKQLKFKNKTSIKVGRKQIKQGKSARKVMGLHSCIETIKVRPKKIRSIYIQKNWKGEKGGNKNAEIQWIISQAQQYRIDLFEQTKEQLASWGEGHQGVALVVEETPVWEFSNQNSSILVYIDGVEDPRNLGSILRTSWLMGVEGVFLPSRNSIRSLTSSVCKTSCGGIEHVPVQFISNPSLWLKKMKEKNFWLYGLDSSAKKPLKEALFSERIILVLGSEGRGIRNSIKNLCDEELCIEQQLKPASYNLSVAMALGLYQISLSK